MLTTTFESHSGRRLRAARSGSGPPLVLLHGYPDTLQIWSRLVPSLSKSFDVIAFDWPGMGYSDAWTGGATPFHMAERLRTLLDGWKIDHAVIAGIDMGGQPALAFAARHPHRVPRLIVMNSLVQWDEVTSWEIALLRKFGWNRFALRYLPRIVFHRALRTFLPRGEVLDASVRSDMWGSFKKREVRDWIVRSCAGYQGSLPNLAKEYPSIQTPTLLLWAEHDKHFPLEQARALRNVLPNSNLDVIPGARHWMPLSMPEEVASRILSFVL
jgi:pimeloyl-ACP methyl ester carboxylesterase